VIRDAGPAGRAGRCNVHEHQRIVATLNDPQVRQPLLDLGFEIVANTPEQFTAFQAAEFARWKKVIETGRITADGD